MGHYIIIFSRNSSCLRRNQYRTAVETWIFTNYKVVCALYVIMQMATPYVVLISIWISWKWIWKKRLHSVKMVKKIIWKLIRLSFKLYYSSVVKTKMFLILTLVMSWPNLCPLWNSWVFMFLIYVSWYISGIHTFKCQLVWYCVAFL